MNTILELEQTFVFVGDLSKYIFEEKIWSILSSGNTVYIPLGTLGFVLLYNIQQRLFIILLCDGINVFAGTYIKSFRILV